MAQPIKTQHWWETTSWILLKGDRGFLWDFRPNRFIKNNSQSKHSILISSCLFFLLVWSFSRSNAILAISGSPMSFHAVFIKNSCEYSRTPLTRTLKGNKKQLELSGSIAKFNFQNVLKTDSYWFFSTSGRNGTWLGIFMIKSDLFVAPIKIKLL